MRRRLGCLGALVALLTLAVGAPAVAFPDVPAAHFFKEAIDTLADRGIVGGFADGTFRPEQSVRRAQFAKVLVGALDLPISESVRTGFVDVPSSGPGGFYPDNYVGVIERWAITDGTGPRTFSPFVDVSRAQAFTLIMRSLTRFRPDAVRYPPLGWTGFWGEFDPGHARWAALAEYNGFTVGLPLRQLDPWGTMPRGEVAQVLYHVLRRLDEHPLKGFNAEIVEATDGATAQVIYRGRDEIVSLIGLQAPPVGLRWGNDATSSLEHAGGPTGLVQLEFDGEERAADGRLLAYVWSRDLQDFFVNGWLLQSGLATYVPRDPQLRHAAILRAAEDEARLNQRGIWYTAEP